MLTNMLAEILFLGHVVIVFVEIAPDVSLERSHRV